MCAWQEFKYRMLLLRAADCGKNSPPSTNQLLQKTSLRISDCVLYLEIFASLSYPRYLYSS
jgi:hypothetical protein